MKALAIVPLLAAAATLTHGPALADGHRDGPGGGSHWGVGVAVLTDTKPYRGYDEPVRIWPLLTYENRWIRVFGPSVQLKLGRSGPVAFSVGASYAGDGYETRYSPFLAGMVERKNSFWLGGQANVRGEFGQLSAEWSADASGKSKGQKFRLALERRYGFGQLGLTPRLAANWHDRKFVSYYYGVQASEALAGRPAYGAGAAVNPEIGLRLDYRLARQHGLFADLSVTALDAAIKNSPLVDRSTTAGLRAGYVYRF